MDIYHVFNRGVEKRRLFMDGRDYARFVHDLYEFNDVKPADNVRHHQRNTDLRNPYFEREKIVDLHGWCLMKNHYHLLVSERVEGGLTLFLRKLNVGYANYFNERYKRSGTLFQGRTKKKLIDEDAYFLYILHYIHLNPLDYFNDSRSWRNGHIKSLAEAIAHLKNYKWSSYLDYCGERNFPSVIATDLFADSYGNVEKKTKEFLNDMNLKKLSPYFLE
ncbi:MAG: transposase [Patescibacteria group bacterium]|nr:transposase [Patescibacteria group bacterium]